MTCPDAYDQIWVAGNKDLGNPSIGCSGLESSFTGFRCDVAIVDDGEVPENSATPGEREKLRGNIAETENILDARKYGERLFIGTPQTYDSIYEDLITALHPEDLCLPIMTNIKGTFPYLTGEYREPKVFGAEYVNKKQLTSATRGAFYNQYLLERVSVDDSRLNPSLLIPYDWEVEWNEVIGKPQARIGPHQIRSVSCFWDPALSEDGKDDSVIGFVYGTDDGHIFVHKAKALKGGVDEQCQQILAFCLENKINRIHVESNGIGAMLPAMLRKVVSRYGIVVVKHFTTQNKAAKIVQAYEVALSAKRLHCHRALLDTKFTSQMRDFNPKKVGKQENDWIDTIAMAILNEPTRIETSPTANRQFGIGGHGGSIDVGFTR